MNNAPARTLWSRPPAVVTTVMFFMTSVFPVAAGLSRNTASFHKWWGILDVGLAFVLVILALAVVAVARSKVDKQAADTTYRAYRILIRGIFRMLVVFFLFGGPDYLD